jgi:hypothetical protein
MKIQPCPRCQHHALVQTGAFWSCNICHLAITTVALCLETRETRGEATQRIARSSA